MTNKVFRPTKQTKRHENQLHSFVFFWSASWANLRHILPYGCYQRSPWLSLFCDKRSHFGAGIGAKNDPYKIGPSIAMVLFQSRRVIDHWATISAVTG